MSSRVRKMADDGVSQPRRRRVKYNSSGYHILVIDNNSEYLLELTNLLQYFQYEVLAVREASAGIRAIKNNKNGEFDLVLADDNLPNMKAPKLVHHVNNVFKLPIVLMAGKANYKVMVPRLDNGVCLYLTKPLTETNVQTLWQYAARAKMVNKGRIMRPLRIQEVAPTEEVVEINDNPVANEEVRVEGNPIMNENATEEGNGIPTFTSSPSPAVTGTETRLLDIPTSGLTNRVEASAGFVSSPLRVQPEASFGLATNPSSQSQVPSEVAPILCVQNEISFEFRPSPRRQHETQETPLEFSGNPDIQPEACLGLIPSGPSIRLGESLGLGSNTSTQVVSSFDEFSGRNRLLTPTPPQPAQQLQQASLGFNTSASSRHETPFGFGGNPVTQVPEASLGLRRRAPSIRLGESLGLGSNTSTQVVSSFDEFSGRNRLSTLTPPPAAQLPQQASLGFSPSANRQHETPLGFGGNPVTQVPEASLGLRRSAPSIRLGEPLGLGLNPSTRVVSSFDELWGRNQLATPTPPPEAQQPQQASLGFNPSPNSQRVTPSGLGGNPVTQVPEASFGVAPRAPSINRRDSLRSGACPRVQVVTSFDELFSANQFSAPAPPPPTLPPPPPPPQPQEAAPVLEQNGGDPLYMLDFNWMSPSNIPPIFNQENINLEGINMEDMNFGDFNIGDHSHANTTNQEFRNELPSNTNLTGGDGQMMNSGENLWDDNLNFDIDELLNFDNEDL